MGDINEKSRVAISRIIDMFADNPDKNVYVGHSGGKDSSCVLHLTARVYPDIRVIHNTKPIWHPDTNQVTDVKLETLAFLYTNVVPVVNSINLVSSDKMADYIKHHELQIQIDGSRVDEYNRIDKSTEFMLNGVSVSRNSLTEFSSNGLFGLSFLYPIYDWTSFDVFDYHKLHNIPLSAEYDSCPEYIDWKKLNA